MKHSCYRVQIAESSGLHSTISSERNQRESLALEIKKIMAEREKEAQAHKLAMGEQLSQNV